jgi:uncharacterized membrane-anchored protein
MGSYGSQASLSLTRETCAMTSLRKDLMVKVPAVTAFFWIIKVLATTVGETFADFLNGSLADAWGLTDAQGLQAVSAIMGSALVIMLIVQFSVRRYIPVIYWLTIVLISVAGTLITDNLHDGLGVELWVTTLVFGMALIVVFAIWHRSERTLAMKSIKTRKREAFYWLAILFTFALGTSAGDQFAESFNFGFAASLAIFAAGIAFVALLWKRRLITEVTGFWICYILTRPLGASLGDLLSQSHKDGGLGLGPNNTSYIFLTLILFSVVFLSVTKKDEIRA